MEKVYIVLTHTGTILSRIIRLITGNEFTHSSIALDKDLEYMYSFGRLNPYNPFMGGFVHEGITLGTFKRFKLTKCSILELPVTKEQYFKMVYAIRNVEKQKEDYHFNVLGLFLVPFKKNRNLEKSFYCAEFVKYVLNSGETNLNLPEIIKPEDFKSIENAKSIYKGLLCRYNKKHSNPFANLEELLLMKKAVL